MAITVENKDSIPGYVYLVDNDMDYKIGITNNPVRRGSSYVTENPRNKVIDCIQVNTYREAEQIEQELIRKMRHLNSFTNSGEWQKRCPETMAIWKSVTSRYSGGGSVDHSEVYERTRRLEKELESTKQKLKAATPKPTKKEKSAFDRFTDFIAALVLTVFMMTEAFLVLFSTIRVWNGVATIEEVLPVVLAIPCCLIGFFIVGYLFACCWEISIRLFN